MNIKKSIIPENRISFNEWCQLYKVGTRHRDFFRNTNHNNLNDSYDFTRFKINKPKSRPNFLVGFIKYIYSFMTKPILDIYR